MISGISSGISGVSGIKKPDISELFSKTDTNGDGKVSKEEFVASRPSDVSETNAASLFDKMDSDGTGALSQTQLQEGMEKNKPEKSSRNLGNTLSDTVLAAVNQLLQSLNSSSDADADGDTSDKSSKDSDMFSKMDTDGNGSVSKQEFLAARPSNVSEDQATKLYSSIDTENTGSITEDQFTSAMQKAPQGPPPSGGAGGPPPSGGSQSETSDTSSSSSSSTTYDALDTNKDGKVSMAELLAGMNEKASSANTDDATKQLLNTISNAIETYAENNSLDLNDVNAFKAVA